jgi:uncharacterized protein YdhG (YjbR/CyaY superfamily)
MRAPCTAVKVHAPGHVLSGWGRSPRVKQESPSEPHVYNTRCAGRQATDRTGIVPGSRLAADAATIRAAVRPVRAVQARPVSRDEGLAYTAGLGASACDGGTDGWRHGRSTRTWQICRTTNEARSRACGRRSTRLNAAAPDATEAISHGRPAFRLDGRSFMGFGVTRALCSFFTGRAPIDAHAAELTGYRTWKGTINFSPDRPLPAELVTTLVRERVANFRPG